MFFLDQLEYNISWQIVGTLFTFSMEDYFLLILHAFFNLYFQDFVFLNYFMTSTLLAITNTNFTCSSASITSSLHLHSEAHTSLYCLHPDSMSTTTIADFQFAIFRTSASTDRTYYIFFEFEFLGSAFIEFF